MKFVMKPESVLFALALGAVGACDKANNETKPDEQAVIDSLIELHTNELQVVLSEGSFRVPDLSKPTIFFGNLTGIPSRGDGQFLGWIYLEESLLVNDLKMWTAWINENRGKLRWDSVKGVHVP